MRTLEKQGVATRLQRLTSDIITEHFIEYSLEVRRVKYSTVATCLRAVRAFLNCAADRRPIEEPPMPATTLSPPRPSPLETPTPDHSHPLLRPPTPDPLVGLRASVPTPALPDT